MNRYARKSLKFLLWLVGIIIVLVGLSLLLIQTAFVQKIAKNKIVSFLEKKIQTPVSIDRLTVDFPKRIVLEGVYFEDQEGDTLLAGDTLKVDISMWKLLDRQIEIVEIDLRGINSYVKRTLPDSAFSFDYILKAFISDKTKEVDTTGAMRFSVSKINLDRINLKFLDDVVGNDVSVYINHFDTKITDFDLENEEFNIPKIKLAGVVASMKQTKALAHESVTTDTLNMDPGYMYPEIKSEEIDISDIHITYANTVNAIDSKVDLDSLLIKFNKLDLRNQDIDVKLLQLKRTQGFFALGERAQKAVEATATEVITAFEKGWTINLDKLDVQDVDYKFDDVTEKHQPIGIDYKHLNLKDLYVDATDFIYNPDTLYGRINQITVTDTSGLFLKNFRANVFYGDNTMHLQDVLFETPQTLIRDQVELHYPSIDSIAKDPGVLNITAHLVDSRIAVKDLILFAPVLANQDPFRKNRNAVILVDGQIDGPIRDLTFTNLTVTGLGQIRLKGSGTITGLPDINKSTFDLRIEDFSATKNDITGFLPAGTIPSNISLPDRLQLRGSFVGSMTSFTTNMNVNSSYGTAKINGTFKNLSSKTRASYNGTISTVQFDAGRLMQMEEKLGKVTFNGTIKGTGMDPKTANATFNGKISEIQYNGYTYQNLTVDGSARNGDIALTADMVDPNINFDLKGTANLNGKYPKVNMTLNLDTLNLLPLKLNEKDLSLKGQIIADLETADPDYLNGTINIANAVIRLDDKRYKLDTISIVSVATEGEDSLHIYSELLTARVKGNYNLTKVWPAMQQSIDNYFDTTPGRDSVIAYGPQQLEFNFRIVRSPLVEELLPDLTEMEDAVIEGNFDSTTDQIVVKGSAPRMLYKDFVIEDFGMNINTEGNALNYAFTLDQLRKKEIQIQNLSFSGKAQNDILDIDLQVKDSEEKDVYRIAGKIISDDNHFDLSLLQDGLVLNKQSWNVAPDNAIHFGSEGLMVTNFKISNAEQSMLVNSNPQQNDAPIDLKFEDFKIATLTRMITKDSLLADGIINGVANVRNLKTNPVFTADLNIQDFSFHGDTVGNIDMKVNNETADTYAAEINLTGYGNDVKMKGTYFVSGETSLYDLKVDIVNLNVKSIEGFTGGEINNGTGALTGDLSIKGTLAAPEIRGDIGFTNVGFTVSRFNSYYRVRDESLKFTSEGIDLNDFTLIDSTGNEAVIGGNIYTKDYRDYRFDLDVRSDNFQVMNSTRENNKLYYGQLYVDAQLKIHGGISTPVVDGSIRVNDKTKLTIVIPQTDPGLIEREGIVEFVDMDTFKLTGPTLLQDSLIQSELTGMDVAVDISIVKEAELNLIIDEANGDYLNVRGQADLAGGIDPSGKMTLTGIYELEEGAYRFSFNQVKREFKIAKGSTISWTGDPLLADVNVTAIYTANTAPLSLVQNQLADAEQNVVNTYKQKLPFEVKLDMKGKLLQPEVTFDIDLPTKNYGVSTEVITTVQSRLVQLRTEPSELNKQVFAVLLLNRFISDDPFVNEARGGGISSLARQSASKLLSEQLNNLVGGIIAGFELSFDINSIEDYTTGELQNRTDLTVGLTKQLLDDRLKVTVGSNFELEGSQESDRKATNIAGDVSAEYQLSKDGRYLIRAYRRDEYIVVQGQVVETGIGFVFTADYDRLKDVFAKKTEEEKSIKKAQRQDEKDDKEVKEE